MTKLTRWLLQILLPEPTAFQHTVGMMKTYAKPLKQVDKELVVPQPAVTDPETWREYIRYS